MLRRNVPSELLKRRSGGGDDDLKRLKRNCNSSVLPLSPSKRFGVNVVNKHNNNNNKDNRLSHEEYIKKILTKPFVIPIDNYKGLCHLVMFLSLFSSVYSFRWKLSGTRSQVKWRSASIA